MEGAQLINTDPSGQLVMQVQGNQLPHQPQQVLQLSNGQQIIIPANAFQTGTPAPSSQVRLNS